MPASLAGRFPMFAPGDLPVSLRDINAIAVIGPEADPTKWALAGPFAEQHDHGWLPDGHVMLVDNAGGEPACGGRPAIEPDPEARAVVWSHDGRGGGPGFASEIRGIRQQLPRGNVLATAG